MLYKAKESYKQTDGLKLTRSKVKHVRLLNGDTVEITTPSKELLNHLREVKNGTGN